MPILYLKQMMRRLQRLETDKSAEFKKCLHLLRWTDSQVEDTFNYQNEKRTADITVEGCLT